MNIQQEIDKIKKLSKEDKEKMKPEIEKILNIVFKDWGPLFTKEELEKIKRDLLGS